MSFFSNLRGQRLPVPSSLFLTLCLQYLDLDLTQSSVQSLSHVRLLVTAGRQDSLSINNSRSPPKPMSNESVMPSNQLILCRPLLLLPSVFPSIRVFSWNSSPGLLFLTLSYSCLVTRHFSTLLILGLACCLLSSSL